MFMAQLISSHFKLLPQNWGSISKVRQSRAFSIQVDVCSRRCGGLNLLLLLLVLHLLLLLQDPLLLRQQAISSLRRDVFSLIEPARPHAASLDAAAKLGDDQEVGEVAAASLHLVHGWREQEIRGTLAGSHELDLYLVVTNDNTMAAGALLGIFAAVLLPPSPPGLLPPPLLLLPLHLHLLLDHLLFGLLHHGHSLLDDFVVGGHGLRLLD